MLLLSLGEIKRETLLAKTAAKGTIMPMSTRSGPLEEEKKSSMPLPPSPVLLLALDCGHLDKPLGSSRCPFSGPWLALARGRGNSSQQVFLFSRSLVEKTPEVLCSSTPYIQYREPNFLCCDAMPCTGWTRLDSTV
jgi:hypothetical protein